MEGKILKQLGQRIMKHKYYYMLLLPGFLIFLLFYYVPLYGILIAFKDFRLTLGILNSPWEGLKWFKILFSGGDFGRIFSNSIIISFLKIIFNFPAPIILALLLNEVRNMKFKRIVQTIIYLPHFMSWVVLSGILILLFSPSTGLQNLVGLETSPLVDPKQFRALLVTSDMWRNAGWGTVIYLAAIAGISPELYEAAIMDGANRFQRVIHITLPSIMGTIVVLLILRTGKIMNAGFEQVFTLYNPIVYEVSDIFDTYVYRVGLSGGRYSLATAAGLFKSVVGFCTIMFTNWLSKRFSGKGVW